MSTEVLRPAAEAGLTAAQFARVREWVYRRTGMQFADSKRYFVDKRVQSCVRAHGGSFDAWYAALRLGADPALGQQLINELTVNETYFLREDHQLDALVRTVLPAVAAQRRAERSRDPIRLLSLPCSTGEEPYSMALRLLEEWEDIAHFDVEVVAGDIDTRALAHARTGEYGERSMSRVPPALRSRHFERLPDSATGQRWRISADLREAIAFSSVNICDPASVRALGAFDVAFCRNLLIYFDAVSMRQAAENLFTALRPGGHLFLGHSESMSRITPVFTPVRLPEGIAYQRPPIGGQR